MNTKGEIWMQKGVQTSPNGYYILKGIAPRPPRPREIEAQKRYRFLKPETVTRVYNGIRYSFGEAGITEP